MIKITEMTQAMLFFHANAGFSHDPKIETMDEGRIRYAQELAAIEQLACEDGMRFEWDHDKLDSSDFSDERPSWQLWVCSMFDAHGNLMESLGGIDLGADGTPATVNYARVVEAELAYAWYPRTEHT